jgi:hypothetical protein
MEDNPLEGIEREEGHEEHKSPGEEAEKEKEKRKSGLNGRVAVAVALLATFMGICNVKDGDIRQSMQQVQAKSVDDWGYYQARNIRGEIAAATADQLKLAEAGAPAALQPQYDAKIKEYQGISDEQDGKKGENKGDAETDARTYETLTYHYEQFDLADALISVAISIFALTILTQKRALFYFALIPAFFGVLMGLAGLFGWHIHPT